VESEYFVGLLMEVLYERTDCIGLIYVKPLVDSQPRACYDEVVERENAPCSNRGSYKPLTKLGWWCR